MRHITEEQYKMAQQRVEELLPLVTDDMSANDPKAVELSLMGDIVIDYEKEHFPIEKPSVASLIGGSLEVHHMTQRQLASILGISPSRVSDFITGKSIPSLHIAGAICKALNIQPALMLGL